MLRISSFFGIVIEMYFGDHPPPHFHARYSGESAKEWTEQHRDELEANWERAVNNDKPTPIEPLK
jgi:hypothetical protein